MEEATNYKRYSELSREEEKLRMHYERFYERVLVWYGGGTLCMFLAHWSLGLVAGIGSLYALNEDFKISKEYENIKSEMSELEKKIDF
ncbi:MAG: hypothetical protein Q8Q01_04670 [archaeon]|nr:hypothetical protein [archaeon]